MEATELRIGNYVNHNAYKTYKQGVIRTINHSTCCITAIGDNYKIDTIKLKSIEPIPLTPGWLTKMGFIREGEWVILTFSPRMGIRFYNGNPGECDIVQDGKYIAFKQGHIKYVHQLQNLYFALAGEELTIKL